MRSKQQGVSIIGGEDGPTSIFVAEESREISLLTRVKNVHYQKKRDRIEKTITANPHTIEEVITYLQDEYGAVEMSQQSEEYWEQRNNVKEALILKYKPELLGDMADMEPPTEYDEESLKAVWEQIELRRKRVESISDEVFPMNFSIYEIKISGVGEIQFCMDTHWEVLEGSYSGRKRGMKKLNHILQDVYLYYGVSKEDIENYSERYSSLVMTLCMD